MRTLQTIVILGLLYLAISCNPSEKKITSENINSAKTNKTSDEGAVYDPILAENLGADDYGMKTYVFALLKSGPNRDQDSTTAAGIQRAHLDNIIRLAEEGKLVAAGPILEQGDFQGIFVFNVETVEEAETLTKTDPAVQAGRLIFEFYPWYSSATLQLINEWHKKVAKVNP